MESTQLPPHTRTVHLGAALIGIGVVEFTVAMVVVQLGYPGYSDWTNYISDLGNTSTSPWHWVFNLSIILLGLFAFSGIFLAWGGFPPGASRSAGLLLLLLASIGAILVGLFPENVNPTVHGLASLTVFGPGGVALMVLGAGFGRGTRWHGLRWASVLLGLVTLVSLAYYVPTQGNNSTWDPGFVERLIVAPILIWGFLASIQLPRDPRGGRGEPPPGARRLWGTRPDVASMDALSGGLRRDGARFHDQDRAPRVMQDPIGNAAEEEPAGGVETAGPHHHQVDGMFFDEPDHGRHGIALEQVRLHAREPMGDEPFFLGRKCPARLVEHAPRSFAGRRGHSKTLRHERDDGEDRQVGLRLVSDRGRFVEGSHRLRGPVVRGNYGSNGHAGSRPPRHG
jgi:hypothetical membrane protein